MKLKRPRFLALILLEESLNGPFVFVLPLVLAPIVVILLYASSSFSSSSSFFQVFQLLKLRLILKPFKLLLLILAPPMFL